MEVGGLYSDFEAVRTATVSIHTGAFVGGRNGRLTVRFAGTTATISHKTSQRTREESEIAEGPLLLIGPLKRTDAVGLRVSKEEAGITEQHAGAI